MKKSCENCEWALLVPERTTSLPSPGHHRGHLWWKTWVAGPEVPYTIPEHLDCWGWFPDSRDPFKVEGWMKCKAWEKKEEE